MTRIAKTADNASETALPGITEIGAEIGAAFASHDSHEAAAFQERRADDYRLARWHDEQAERALARTYALRALLPTLPAKSLTDAAVQIAEAINLVSLMSDHPDEQERDQAAVIRLLYSATEAIEAETGQSPPFGLFSAYASPWRDAQEPQAAEG